MQSLALLEQPSTLSRNGSTSDAAVVAQLTDVVNDLRRTFADRNALYRDIDAVVFGELPVDIPEAYRKVALEVHAPLALHIVSTVTAALSVNPISYSCRPVGFGDAANENATLREHFFESSWERQMEEARRRLDRLFMANLVTKGEGVLKTLERTKRAWSTYGAYSKKLQDALDADTAYRDFDQHAKDHLYDRQTEEYKLHAPYPISTTDVPPETFYYQKTEDGLTFCAEVKQVPYLETLQKFGAGLSRNGRVIASPQLDPRAMGLGVPEDQWSQAMGRTRTLTCIEGWDCEYVTTVLLGPGQVSSSSGQLGRGTLVKRIKHGYGDPLLKTLKGPYFHALGVTTASRLPHRAGLGILFGFLRLFPLLNAMLTTQSNAAFMTGFPAFKRTVPPGVIPGLPANAPYGLDGTEREAAEETIEPGTIYPYDIAPVEMPRSGPEMDKTIGMVRAFIELALPSVVQGVVSGDESGYALNQAAHLARLAWDPIVSNAETCHGERVGFESWLIENRIGEKVYAWGEAMPPRRGRRSTRRKASGWLGIGPDDLGGVHRYKARLDPQTPSNEVIETRAIREQMAEPALITYEEAVERVGGNPDEVQRSWLAQRIWTSDEVQGEIAGEVLRRANVIRQKRMQRPGMPTPEEMLGLLPGEEPVAAGGPGGVFHPGYGMPETPTPDGSVAGMGPAGRALAQGGIAGAPNVQALPARHIPLPGGA